MKGPHHRGTFDRRAAAVRAAAEADPDTRCRRCGHRLHEGPEHKHDGTERWQAGHVVDGEVNGALAPEAESCNKRAAALATNAKRARRRRGPDPHSREW